VFCIYAISVFIKPSKNEFKDVEKEVVQNVEVTPIVEEAEEVKDPFENYELFRLTHYYTGDPYGSGTCTASGICTNRFDTHINGWYMYKGKLVVANGVDTLYGLN
jgi:hypothetical protein